MDLVEWAPFVFKTSSRPGHNLPMIEFRAWLRCLFCGQAEEVRTKPPQEIKLRHKGTYLDTADSHTFFGIDQLSRQRACRNCGQRSDMPEKDVERLKKEMGRRVTSDWLKSQVESELPDFIRIKEELKGLDQQVGDFLKQLAIKVDQQMAESTAEMQKELKRRLPSMIRHQLKDPPTS